MAAVTMALQRSKSLRRRPRVYAALALLVLAAGCQKRASGEDEEKAPAIAVHCVTAARVAIEPTLSLRGRIAPPPGGDLPVAAQVPGRVIESRVKEGERLAKGALVAIVDDLAPRAAEKQASASLARARSAALNAQASLERVQALAAQGIASKREVEDATARADAAKAEVDADVAAQRLASGNLGRVEVRTTFEGVVTKVWRGVGALVDGTAATPIVQLAATGAVEFVADVTERELAATQEGQKAEVLLSSSDTRLLGVVLARSRALDPGTGLGAVRIQLLSAAEGAAPPLGAFGKLQIAQGRREGVMVIPPSALRGAVADGAEIAICNGDKAEIRAVKVGYRDPSQVEITEGLKEGEKVAVDHVLGLEEGTKLEEAKDEAPGKKEGIGKKEDEDAGP